ncbi:MAG: hypothetical protein MSIBF_00030 [Candidatus Altiarchaeales archaeon IMC4]|nr:MAG: hypothetical protein MSIBF_00030 [Candidatus Altiarchaeales archaeon IMC4]
MLKIGKTPFRNTEFIYHGFEKVAEEINKNFKFYTDYPSKLGEMLVKGELDIAPASSIIYARHPGKLLILPGISISAKGKTNSILVFSNTLSSPEDISGKTIALPFTSASSIALIEIILKMKKINAKFIYNQEPDIERMLRKADAGLLIGDNALVSFSKNRVLADLGEEWYKLTEKSMVYALWFVNKKTAQEKPEEIKEFTRQLYRAREYSYKDMDTISKELASQISIDGEFLKGHLSSLSYDFGEKEKSGLLEYLGLAEKFKIINKIPDLEFF